MAKLTVTLDGVFETSPFIKHDHKKFQRRSVSVAELKKSLSGAERGEFGVQVVLVGATGEREIGFLLEAAGLKNGGVFEWAIDQRQARATVTVKGEFVVALRAGVAPSIKNAGKKASLRLEKFTFKGGAWNGWEGAVQGDTPLPEEARAGVREHPVCFGHYWLTGSPTLLSSRAACVDYSAGAGGPLVAYRYDGEPQLERSHLTWVS